MRIFYIMYNTGMRIFRNLLFISLLCMSGSLLAGTFDGFSANVTRENMKPFAKDLGGLIGAGTFTTGRVLGWGGFQIGPRAAVMFEPSEENTALGQPSEVGSIVMPWVQADIGMPFRVDGFIRAGSYDGLTISGGGLRWGTARPVEEMLSFQTMIVAAAHSVVADSFSATHYNANLVLSMTMKHFTPYIGAGIDCVRLSVKDINSSLNNEVVTSYEPRYTAGINYKLPWFLDLSLAANLASYGFGAEGSFSLRF